jgi:hypothetical protein
MDEELRPIGLILGAFVALAVFYCAIRGLQGRWRLAPLAVVFAGGGISWLFSILSMLIAFPHWFIRFAESSLDLSQSPLMRLATWLSSGVFWLILYHALRRVSLNSWARRIVALIAVIFVGILYDGVIALFEMRFLHLNLQRPPFPSMDQMSEAYAGVSGVLSVVFIAFQLWLVSAWQRASGETRSYSSNTILAVGSKGLHMSKLTNQSTRLLCASVLLGHGGAREKLLTWLKDPNRAVGLELGVDLRLAAQVARFAEKRNRRGWWIYFGIFCASLLASLITPIAGILGLIAAGIFWFIRSIEERDSFAPMFSLQSFNPEEIAKQFPADLEADDLSALPLPNQNFFVYGGFSPFVGAGQDFGGWSVVIALDKPASSFGVAATPKPFEIREVYKAIDSGLDSLGVNEVQKTDCFFARGTDVRGSEELLPNIHGRPVRVLDDSVASQYLYADDAKVRQYRCYRIIDWGGELALSYYIRCSRRGSTLFVETKRFLLTPLGESLRVVDNMVDMDASEKFGALMAGLIAGPLCVVASPFWAFSEVMRILRESFGIGEERNRQKAIEKNPLFNYGAVTSLRQALSSGNYGHYFQKMDGDLYNKLFEHEVLDSLVEFLDAHGVDTSDLKERQNTILNNGVIVQGGDVKAESLAVGAGSQAVKRVQSAFAGKLSMKGAEG